MGRGALSVNFCASCGRWLPPRSVPTRCWAIASIGRSAPASLPALRAAREAFHNQPEELKRRLMRGIFEAPMPAKPSKRKLLEQYTEQEPEPFVRFDAYPAARADDLGLSVELEHQLCDDVPVRVLISPGTLPASAAQALRHIADRIETDRRLLSARHWQTLPYHRTNRRRGPPPAAGDSADQA